MSFAMSRANVFLISVNACSDGNPIGSLFDTRTGSTIEFNSMSQMLLQINDALMQSPYGQANLRTLLPAIGTTPDKPPQYGRLATFTLRILFRQNATWQGEVSWLERRENCTFRSVLELMQQLDRALRGESLNLQKESTRASAGK